MSSITQGHYYNKQLGCDDSVIAWSHRSRFLMALKLLGDNPGTVMDYGSGDGTFLAMASPRIVRGVGVDLAIDQIEDCRLRLEALQNLEFHPLSALADRRHVGAYNRVYCMETLEHCLPPVVDIVLADLARLVSPTGQIIVSVPIEIGPTFAAKYVLRTAAAWRGLSDYKYYERYRLSDALRMAFAGARTSLDRPVHHDKDGTSHSHYGFNWRALRSTVGRFLNVERTLFSPFGFSAGLLSSQAWFICRPLRRPSQSL